MPETSDGSPSPGSNNQNNQNTSSSSNRRSSKSHARPAARESKFKGKCTELKGTVYDIVVGKDTFLKTTREIAEYVGRTFDDAGEFRTGMVDLQLPDLDKLAQPANRANAYAIEIWKLDRREYNKHVCARKKNSDQVVALLLGQCSQALRNRMEANNDWETVNTNSDAIGLLQIIQRCMSQRQTRSNNSFKACCTTFHSHCKASSKLDGSGFVAPNRWVGITFLLITKMDL